MNNNIFKEITVTGIIASMLFFGAVVFGQEKADSISSGRFTPPTSAPELEIEPLLDPDVAIINPPRTVSSNPSTEEILYLPDLTEESGGDLQRIEESLDIWTGELDKIDVYIMKIQRGDASAEIMAEDKRLFDNIYVEDNDVKNNTIDLMTLKKNREYLIKHINETGEAIKTKLGSEEDTKSLINNVKNVDFDPNDIIGELEDIMSAVENIDTQNLVSELESVRIEKINRIKERVLFAKKIEQGEVLEEDIYKDTDEDGISDYDENYIYGTNYINRDSDGDGYTDGLEILVGFDPLNASRSGVIVYENPKKTLVEATDIFTVNKIEFIQNEEMLSDVSLNKNLNHILMEGKALPNSFVTLYIFSIPTIVTLKTDIEGNWTYVLDKEIENGAHELYVATTDNSGRILAKSRPIPFTKEAAAITVDPGLLSFATTQYKPGFFSGFKMYGLILFFIAVLGGFVAFIGRNKEQDRFRIIE